MAGAYPDVPGRRLAYDDDGTYVYGFGGNITPQADGVAVPQLYTPWSVGQRQTINNENPNDLLSLTTQGGGVTSALIWNLIFPELREVDGYYYNANIEAAAGGGHWLYSSTNTTSGRDGTWTAMGSQVRSSATTLENYRQAIQSAALTGIRGVSTLLWGFGTNGSIQLRRFHVYGDITPGSTPDRLLWLDEGTGLEFTADIDHGDIPRGGSEDVELRIRNNSETLTATTIQYTTESLYRGGHTWYTFTLPGGSTFQATRSIGSLAPETSTGIITMRRITPGDQSLGLYASRIFNTTNSWS